MAQPLPTLRRRRFAVALIATAAALTVASPAAAFDWTGGDPGGSFFHLSGNWAGGLVPGNGAGGTTNFALGGQVQWNALTGDVLNDGELRVTGAPLSFVGSDGAYRYRMKDVVMSSGGKLQLDRIAVVANRLTIIGGAGGVSGLTVSGPGSSLGTDRLVVGNFFGQGDGVLDIDNGGRVTSADETIIGSFRQQEAIGNAAVTVTGLGSSFANGGTLFVGQGSQYEHTLQILNGATTSSVGGVIGDHHTNGAAGAVSAVTVSGVGSAWTNTGDLAIGAGRLGDLQIVDGGTVSNLSAAIGSSGNSQPGTHSATVSGAGSSWVNSGRLRVGDVWDSRLDITDGALVSSQSGWIGPSFRGMGVVSVTGAGSRWTNVDGVFVGGTDSFAMRAGTLTVGAGAAVHAGTVLKIWAPGTVTLDGGLISATALDKTGSWNFNSGTFRYTGDKLLEGPELSALLGAGPVPSLTAGRTVEVVGTATLGSALRLAGGALAVGGIDAASAALLDLESGSFSLTNGPLRVDATAASLFGPNATFGVSLHVTQGALQVGPGGVLTTTAGFSAQSVDNRGNVIHLGAANLVNGLVDNRAGAQLAVLRTGSGPAHYGQDAATAILGAPTTVVENRGDLVLNGVELVADLQGFAGSTLTVLGNVHVWGTFSGVTDVYGPGTLSTEGLAPGSSPALMLVEGNLALAGTTFIELGGMAPGTGHDQVRVAGALTLGGVLDVALIDDLTPGYRPAAGDSFTLFSAASLAGGFTDMRLPALGDSLRWQVAQGPTDFSLGVTAVPEPGAWALMAAGLGLLAWRLRRDTAG